MKIVSDNAAIEKNLRYMQKTIEDYGGFIDPDTTPSLMNVQCESCHGAARKHVESGGIKPVANANWPSIRMCEQCHTQPHSPGFNFETYWPKIAHGTPPLSE